MSALILSVLFFTSFNTHADEVDDFVTSVGVSSLSTDILLTSLEGGNKALLGSLDYLQYFAELGAPRTKLQAKIADLGDVFSDLTALRSSLDNAQTPLKNLNDISSSAGTILSFGTSTYSFVKNWNKVVDSQGNVKTQAEAIAAGVDDLFSIYQGTVAASRGIVNKFPSTVASNIAQKYGSTTLAKGLAPKAGAAGFSVAGPLMAGVGTAQIIGTVFAAKRENAIEEIAGYKGKEFSAAVTGRELLFQKILDLYYEKELARQRMSEAEIINLLLGHQSLAINIGPISNGRVLKLADLFTERLNDRNTLQAAFCREDLNTPSCKNNLSKTTLNNGQLVYLVIDALAYIAAFEDTEIQGYLHCVADVGSAPYNCESTYGDNQEIANFVFAPFVGSGLYTYKEIAIDAIDEIFPYRKIGGQYQNIYGTHQPSAYGWYSRIFLTTFHAQQSKAEKDLAYQVGLQIELIKKQRAENLAQEELEKALEINVVTPPSVQVASDTKTIFAEIGDEIVLQLSSVFNDRYFGSDLPSIIHGAYPVTLWYNTDSDTASVSALYDRNSGGLVFTVNTDEPFDLIRVNYVIPDSVLGDKQVGFRLSKNMRQTKLVAPLQLPPNGSSCLPSESSLSCAVGDNTKIFPLSTVYGEAFSVVTDGDYFYVLYNKELTPTGIETYRYVINLVLYDAKNLQGGLNKLGEIRLLDTSNATDEIHYFRKPLMTLTNDFLYITTEKGLISVDVNSPQSLSYNYSADSQLDGISSEKHITRITHTAIYNNKLFAYKAGTNYRSYGYIIVYDISSSEPNPLGFHKLYTENTYGIFFTIIENSLFIYNSNSYKGPIYDISDPTNIITLDNVPPSYIHPEWDLRDGYRLKENDDGIGCVTHFQGITIYDAEDNRILSSWKRGSGGESYVSFSVSFNNKYCVVSSGSGLHFFNIEDPTKPVLDHSFPPAFSSTFFLDYYEFAVTDTHVLFPNAYGELVLLDITGLKKPIEHRGEQNLLVYRYYSPTDENKVILRVDDTLKLFSTDNGGFNEIADFGEDVAGEWYGDHDTDSMNEDVAVGFNSSNSSIKIFDISNKDTSILVASLYEAAGDVNDVVLAENRLFLATDVGVEVVDITDPYSPTIIAQWVFQNYELGFAKAQIKGDHLYLISTIAPTYVGSSSYINKLVELDISDISNPAITWEKSNPEIPNSYSSQLHYMDLKLTGDYLSVITTDNDYRNVYSQLLEFYILGSNESPEISVSFDLIEEGLFLLPDYQTNFVSHPTEDYLFVFSFDRYHIFSTSINDFGSKGTFPIQHYSDLDGGGNEAVTLDTTPDLLTINGDYLYFRHYRPFPIVVQNWKTAIDDKDIVDYYYSPEPSSLALNIISELPTDFSYSKISSIKEWEFDSNIDDLTFEVLSSTYINFGGLIKNGTKLTAELNPDLTADSNELVLQVLDSDGKLVKVNGRDVLSSTSITNQPPELASGVATQMVGTFGERVYLYDWGTFDIDGDTVTVSVVNTDGGTIGLLSNSSVLYADFSDNIPVHNITVRLSDGKSSTDVDITVLRFDAETISDFYSDVSTNHAYSKDIAFSTLEGIVGGQADPSNNAQRIYRPDDAATWAETLKVILQAADKAEISKIPDSPVGFNVLPEWVIPYYSHAVAEEAIDLDILDLGLESPTREQVARLAVKILRFDDKVADIKEIAFDFTDGDDFSSPRYRWYGEVAHVFGVFMAGNAANPQGTVTRGELARVVSRISMIPQASLDMPDSFAYGNIIDVGDLANVTANVINNSFAIVDNTANLSVGYAMNRHRLSDQEVPVSFTARGDNELIVAITNDGVSDIIRKTLVGTVNDADNDGVIDEEDEWPNDARYSNDDNNNGIPDSLDEYYGLYDLTPSDSILINGESILISGLISQGLCVDEPTNAYHPLTFETAIYENSCDVPQGWVIGEIPDSDNDGIKDHQDNCPFGSNANQANYDNDSHGDVCDTDDDNDGMPDAWETKYGLNPKSPSDKNKDPDSDGRDNLQEYKDGTNPNVADEKRKVPILPVLQLLLGDD